MKQPRRLPAALPAFLAAAALVLALTGCSSSAAASSTAAMDSASTSAEAFESSPAESSADNILDAADRKVTYNAVVEMETTDFDAACAGLTDAVTASGGYMAASSQRGTAEDGGRTASYTARVPAGQYRDFLAAAGSLGNVLYTQENAEDITAQTIDVEARLAALEAQRDRLNALADTAATTADLLEIESQLSDVQYEIESYTRQRNALADLVRYSTVDLTLREVEEITPPEMSFPARAATAFTDGWRGFGTFCETALLALIALSPLWLLAGIIAALVLVIRASRPSKHGPKGGGTGGTSNPNG